MSSLPHNYRTHSGPMLALGSAFLFGASTPIAKLLLGITDPLLLAGLLYLGSGTALHWSQREAVRFDSGAPRPRCAHATSLG
jgi:hypothetical protein